MFDHNNKIQIPTNQDYSIADLITDYNDWRDDAPYQRDYAWDDIRNTKLIVSLFNNIPIGTFHIVFDQSQKFYWILDGKQRRKAIYDFNCNKTKIPVIISETNVAVPVLDTDDENLHHLNYQEMSSHADERVVLLAKSFKKRKISASTWQPMPILDARDLFNQINYSSSLNMNERIYCPNFLAKKFYHFVFDQYFSQNVKQFFRYKSIPNNKRFTGIRFVHDLCRMCFGDDMQSTFSVRTTGKVEMSKSASVIHDFFLKKGIGDNDVFNDDLMQKLGFMESLRMLKNCCKIFQKVMNYKNTLNKGYDANLIFDVICFWIMKIQSKNITFAQIEKNLESFYEFVIRYVQCRAECSLKNNSKNENKLRKRIDQMEKIMSELEFDMGEKNRLISSQQKVVTLMKSNGNCEMCGKKLNGSNYEIDHVYPKSVHSETSVGVICQECNRKKSNLTKNDCEELMSYFENKENN